MGRSSAKMCAPTDVVRVITPFPPGGTSDISALLVAQEFTRALGHQFVAENRPRENTVIGTDAAARAKPGSFSFASAGIGSIAHMSIKFMSGAAYGQVTQEKSLTGYITTQRAS